MSAWAADLVLGAHLLVAGFNVFGLVFIWIGAMAGWRIAGNRWLRALHLASTGVVAAVAAFGELCPLTSWENRLRAQAGQGAAYQDSFLRHYAERWFYFEAPVEAFAVAYVIFFVLVLATLRLVPVRWRG